MRQTQGKTMMAKRNEKLAQEVVEMKKSHEEKCREMRKRWGAPKKKKRPYVKRRPPFATKPPVVTYKPLPPPGDPKDVIAGVKAEARDFCLHNCRPQTIGHHVGCAFWLWDEDGYL